MTLLLNKQPNSHTNMDAYKSNEEIVNYNISTVYGKLSNPECFKQLIDNDNIPGEMKQRLSDVEFSNDSISFTANPVGKVNLQIVERTQPTRIVMTAQPFPIAFKAIIDLDEINNTQTKILVTFEIDLNIMLRAMASKPLGDGVKKFGQMLAMLPYDRL